MHAVAVVHHDRDGMHTPRTGMHTPRTGMWTPGMLAKSGTGKEILRQQGCGRVADRAIFWHYPLYLKGISYNQVIPIHGTDRMYWRATPCSIIRKADWKLMQFFESEKTELYNIKSDLSETNNLAHGNPEKVAALLGELKQWQAETKAIIPSKLNPDFNSADVPTKQKNGRGKRLFPRTPTLKIKLNNLAGSPIQ